MDTFLIKKYATNLRMRNLVSVEIVKAFEIDCIVKVIFYDVMTINGMSSNGMRTEKSIILNANIG